MTAPASALDRAAFWFIAASLGIVQLNLLVAQVLFGVAAILWLVLIARGRRAPMPAFLVPLGVYAGLTVISALASDDPRTSMIDNKQLVLFLVVPIVVQVCVGTRAFRVLDIIIAIGAAGALVGIVQFAMLGYSDTSNRPVGALSHYMTYSGVLMLVTCAAVARLIYYRREWVWPAIAVPALVVALAVTFTRNAWIGTVVGVGTLVALRRPRLLWVLPVAVVVGFALAPEGIRQRALSTFDMNDPTVRDRFAMMEVGRRLVLEFPLLGVGPDRIKTVYADYRPDYGVNATNPHLHNVPIQIAAERGLPALGAWLWFIVVAARDLWRQLRLGQAPALAGAGLAAVAAMLSAGWFEYNFGDSEFLMLFLGLIALPHAARRDESGEPREARDA
ncbi:MAG TPA: O-antigen ligase family protein [Vicinamibacterales bacterium]|nr:O-antigen ligase family protein [Vicinamibacterales bacterium]